MVTEIVYGLTVMFVVYVVYMAEGDQIVAFIHKTFRIDLSHPHQCCTDMLNRMRNSGMFKWCLPF